MQPRNLPRVPEHLIGGLAYLPEIFHASAKWRGISRGDVDRVVKILPDSIHSLTCVLDKITKSWLYDYAKPYAIEEKYTIGLQMVDRLFDVLYCALMRLPHDQLGNYLKRLADRNTHLYALFEFAPIARLSSAIHAEYEVTGYGEGNTTVDWVLRSGKLSIAFDVKTRLKDLVQLFRQLSDSSEPSNIKPILDSESLFKSLEKKFVSRSPSELIQGAWIVMPVKQDNDGFLEAFHKLDLTRIHFAVLGDFDSDVHILAVNAKVKQDVLSLLHLHESDRFVFQPEPHA